VRYAPQLRVDQQEDLWIKVPGPFYGVGTVGFSVRYSQEPELPEPATVTFFVEGEAAPLEALAHSLRLFPERERFVDCEAPGEAYGWSDPINLSDEVIVMAFKDRSLDDPGGDPAQAVRNRLSNQMVPLAFPFLRDCVRVADLRLSSWISVRLTSARQPEIEISLPVRDIVADNGRRTLVDL
jgi:hypothetical protein